MQQILRALIAFILLTFTEVQASTVIDILSEQEGFSTFLRALQVRGLVPWLNEFQNFTLVAPVNSAFSEDGSLSKKDLEKYIIPTPIFTSESASAARGGADTTCVKVILNSFASPNSLGEPVFVKTCVNGALYFDTSEVVKTDLVASSQNAVVQGVDSLMLRKEDMRNTIEHCEASHSFSRVLSAQTAPLSNVTGLIPLNVSFYQNEIELEYLVSQQGENDLKTVIDTFFVDGYIGGAFEQKTTLNRNGKALSLKSSHSGEHIILGPDRSVDSVLASDSVIHLFHGLHIDVPVTYTPRKYLYGMNQTQFVAEVDFRNLRDLIDDSSLDQTIFVPSSDEEDMALPRSSLRYSFVDSRVTDDGERILTSKYCPSRLGKGCQKITIATAPDGTLQLNGQVTVMSNEIRVGNTSIYLVDEALTLPPKLSLALKAHHRLSKSEFYLKQLGKTSLSGRGENGFTGFLPGNGAWKDLGLITSYFDKNLTALDQVLSSLIIKHPVYSNFEGEIETTTFEGAPVFVVSTNGSVSMNESHSFPLGSDILFREGVVHEIPKVLFPESLSITLADIMGAVDSAIFYQILSLANMSHVLNQDSGYSVLLPTSSSLKSANISYVTSDASFLERFLSLHVLPPGSTESVLNCNGSIETLAADSHLACRLVSGTRYLQIVEGDNHEVRIIDKGCSTDAKGCIFVIDRPIMPSWRNRIGDRLSLHLRFVSVAIGILIGIFVFSIVLACCLTSIVTRYRTTLERRPLLEDCETSEHDANFRE